MAGEGQKSKGDEIVDQINAITNSIGALVPTVAAIGGVVRLIATAFRPTDAQKAQAFDAAIAELDQKLGGLDSAIAGFEAAKAAAAARAGAPASGAGGPMPSDG